MTQPHAFNDLLSDPVGEPLATTTGPFATSCFLHVVVGHQQNRRISCAACAGSRELQLMRGPRWEGRERPAWVATEEQCRSVVGKRCKRMEMVPVGVGAVLLARGRGLRVRVSCNKQGL